MQQSLGRKSVYLLEQSVRFTEKTVDKLSYLWIFVQEEA